MLPRKGERPIQRKTGSGRHLRGAGTGRKALHSPHRYSRRWPGPAMRMGPLPACAHLAPRGLVLCRAHLPEAQITPGLEATPGSGEPGASRVKEEASPTWAGTEGGQGAQGCTGAGAPPCRQRALTVHVPQREATRSGDFSLRVKSQHLGCLVRPSAGKVTG